MFCQHAFEAERETSGTARTRKRISLPIVVRIDVSEAGERDWM
jgi:hypothetical protein